VSSEPRRPRSAGMPHCKITIWNCAAALLNLGSCLLDRPGRRRLTGSSPFMAPTRSEAWSGASRMRCACATITLCGSSIISSSWSRPALKDRGERRKAGQYRVAPARRGPCHEQELDCRVDVKDDRHCAGCTSHCGRRRYDRGPQCRRVAPPRRWRGWRHDRFGLAGHRPTDDYGR